MSIKLLCGRWIQRKSNFGIFLLYVWVHVVTKIWEQRQKNVWWCSKIEKKVIEVKDFLEKCYWKNLILKFHWNNVPLEIFQENNGERKKRYFWIMWGEGEGGAGLFQSSFRGIRWGEESLKCLLHEILHTYTAHILTFQRRDFDKKRNVFFF